MFENLQFNQLLISKTTVFGKGDSNNLEKNSLKTFSCLLPLCCSIFLSFSITSYFWESGKARPWCEGQ